MKKQHGRRGGYGWPFKRTTQTSKEFIDYDYLDQLSDSELQWLSDFTKANYLNDNKSMEKLKGRKLTKNQRTKRNKANWASRNDAQTRSVRTKGEVIVPVVSTPESILIAREELNLRVSRQALKKK